MFLIVLVCSLSLAATGQQRNQDDWIDPYDMLNYDTSTKTMRKPAEPATYPDVPTKRREYTQDARLQQACERQLEDLEKQIEEKNKRINLISQQPTCAPVFKRFLSRLLKEIQRVGSPTDSMDVSYDATIKLSRQSMTEIQTLLEGEESWRTGALDNAISQILVDLKPHDYEAWKWRFEDTFGVELDTLLKMSLCVLVIVAIICTQLWSRVSWLVQSSRLFAVCFFISIIWTWLYQYKIAFAEHQKNIAKLDGISEKCTGLKRMEWSDSLKEWFRGTFTLQDDPCKKYHEVLIVNPLLLVPPTKAISATIVTFITEPLKHIGEGIGDFIRALLKDLPITLQIPVFLTIVLSFALCIVTFIYGGMHAAFQHGIMAPFQRPRRDPPPPRLQQPHLPAVQEVEDHDHLGGGDAPRRGPRPAAIEARSHGNAVHQRQPNRRREKVIPETIRTAERLSGADGTDARQREAEQNLSESDSENQQETEEEVVEAPAADKTKPAPKDSPQSDAESQREARRRAQPDVQDQKASAGKRTTSDSQTHVETVPVQESAPVSAE